MTLLNFPLLYALKSTEIPCDTSFSFYTRTDIICENFYWREVLSLGTLLRLYCNR